MNAPSESFSSHCVLVETAWGFLKGLVGWIQRTLWMYSIHVDEMSLIVPE